MSQTFPYWHYIHGWWHRCYDKCIVQLTFANSPWRTFSVQECNTIHSRVTVTSPMINRCVIVIYDYVQTWIIDDVTIPPLITTHNFFTSNIGRESVVWSHNYTNVWRHIWDTAWWRFVKLHIFHVVTSTMVRDSVVWRHTHITRCDVDYGAW
jgi:hypothetical protein